MPKNLIACRPGCYGKFEKEAFRHLAEIGVRCVECDVPAEEQWGTRKAQLDRFGLRATSVSGGVNLSKPDFVATLTRLANGARTFGAKIIFLSVQSGGIPLPQAYQKLRELGDIAKKYGMTIAMETHPDMVTNGDVAVATMKGVNHPNVRLNYDSANLYYYNEGVDGIAELKKFIPYLASCHIKETNGKPKAWYFPGLHEGQGIVNFPEIFKLCNAAGFFGPFTMEIEGIEGEQLGREQVLARVANSVSYLKLIGAM
ncbi:MAG TPA: sugar phosphate isomerase/epimerase family protein [Planctomycetota bacterium]